MQGETNKGGREESCEIKMEEEEGKHYYEVRKR